MIKPPAYIDQGILGMQIDGSIALTTMNEFYWVYSKEHFIEICRSASPDPYLQVLHEIDAKLLDLAVDDQLNLTGAAKIVLDKTVDQNYQGYLDSNQSPIIESSLFDPFIVWLNSGGDKILSQEYHDKVFEQIVKVMNLSGQHREEHIKQLIDVQAEFVKAINSVQNQSSNILKIREQLGMEKGYVGSLSGDNILLQIWNIVKMDDIEMSIDQFFGFEPIKDLGEKDFPLFLGIVRCCAVLDILGYKAEKKCRKIEKIPNIKSDSTHIAMGAFCAAIATTDDRFRQRAKAIYQFKDIKTKVIHLKKG